MITFNYTLRCLNGCALEFEDLNSTVGDTFLSGFWDPNRDWKVAQYTLSAGVHQLRWAFSKFSITADAASGLSVVFTHGTAEKGCFQGGERQTTVAFICDPSAEVGSPEAGNPLEDKNHTCYYNFIWNSLYACPLCSSRDYTFVFSPCVGGVQSKYYYWIDNPKRCHDGAALPEPEHDIVCSNDVYCPPGQYHPPNASPENPCVYAQPGYFSIGGGQLWQDFYGTSWLGDFENRCLGISNCQPWVSRGFALDSGAGDSELVLTRNWIEPGTFSFTYRVVADNYSGFQLLIDNIVVQSNRTAATFGWKTATYNLTVGTHIIRFQFLNGRDFSTTARERGVSIREISITGISKAADIQTPCPPGTFSSNEGAIRCDVCPWNTYSSSASTSCAPCTNETFAFPESAACTRRPDCDASYDYQEYRTPCTNNQQVSYWVKLAPDICLGGEPIPQNITRNCEDNCASFGLYPLNDECLACPEGQYPTGNSANPCSVASPGSYAMPILTFFNGLQELYEWPAGWSTDCGGDCGTPGWRLRGDRLGSGFHLNQEVESFVTYTANWTVPGYITFLYSVVGDDVNGLEFFIDKVPQTLDYHPVGSEFYAVTYQVPLGVHSLLWNFHQKQDTIESYTEIMNIELGGVTGGGSKYQLCSPGYFGDGTKPCSPCPPGQYAAESGSATCAACPENFYSAEYGASTCTKCATGSISQSGATVCTIQCIFPNDKSGDFIDLTALRGTTGPLGDATGLTRDEFYLDICGFVDQNICPGIPGYVCEKLPSGEVYNAGRVFDASFAAIGNTSDTQLVLTYSNGDEAGCPAGVKRHSSIVFQCISESETQMTKPVLSLINNQCARTFVWKHNAACRTCEPQDYERTESDCVKGFQEISEAKIVGTLCYGPAIKSLKQINCEDVKFPLGGVIGGVAALAAIFIIVAIILVRNRMVISRYRNMERETAQIGSGDVELEEGGPTMEDARL
eukprot:TRINITY_DN1481_c0_g1_i5.p1 TRINITY_DN1481_c0_g1~~TRINITY_DN1481_c0_g1_i5.p1  ORF type:complete len:967 (-),score=188.51 TRINITY_DN1481_c0_g1_i5:66-2966(-)